MSYQVLARKWRPQDFSAIIGQGSIVTALRNALAEDRIAQAYVFSGIRGVGKTSTARVLAKALNCETRRTDGGTDPCNACGSCLGITAGSDIDVIEVDAATYSKVEQVRELTESLRYAPAGDRYKVVVLDEVHRLSRQAFDALLKIVEEPPAHLVFIFATTELDAVPATILSRCQQFQFRRVTVSEVAEHLANLAKQESITTSEEALRIIARAGEGSVRDAVALLDQLATFGNGSIEDEDAARLVGGLDRGLLEKLLAAIIDGAPRAVHTLVAEIDAVGLDPAGIYGHFVAYVRDALHLALDGDAGTVDLSADEAASLKEIAGRAGYENLLRLLQLLLTSEDTVRRSDLGALALEITWLRAAELPKLVAVESLLRGDTPMPETAKVTTARTAEPAERRAVLRAPVEEDVPAPQSSPEAASPEAASPEAAPPDAPPLDARPAPPPRTTKPRVGTARVDQVSVDKRPVDDAPEPASFDGDPMPRIIAAAASESAPVGAQLRRAQSMRYEDGVLHVVVARDDSMLESALGRQTGRAAMDAAVASVIGSGLSWVVERGSAAAKPKASTPPEAQARRASAKQQQPPASRPSTPQTAKPKQGPAPRSDSTSTASSKSAATVSSDGTVVQAALELFDGAVIGGREPLAKKKSTSNDSKPEEDASKKSAPN